MTIAELREIVCDPDLAPDTPVRVRTGYRVSTWEWELEGAHGTLAGPDRHLILELRAVTLVEEAPAPPPPFNPDPELIDHLEGNQRERDRYRDEARRLREENL